MHELLSLDFATIFQSFDLSAFNLNDWDPERLFENGADKGKVIGGAFIGLLGVVVFIFAGWYLAKIAFKKQERGSHVVEAVIALCIGGLLAFGGFSLIEDVGNGGYDTVEDLGK